MDVLVLLVLLAQSAADPHQTALAQYRKHSYADAAAAFRTALQSENPGTAAYAESVLLLGQSLFLSNQPGEAAPWLEKAERSSEVLYMLGSAYLKSRDLDRATATFAEMYGVKPKSAAAYLIAAQMMIRQNLEDDAAKQLERALELDPKLPQVHYLLGEISTFRGAPDRAIAYLKEEIALNPDFAMAYYKLGDAYTRRSEWTAAIAFLQKSIWLNPDFSGPYILLGKCYGKTDRLADAEGVLRHAIQLDPRNYSAHYLLGQTLMQAGHAEEGRQMLELSQKLKPQ